MSEEDFYNQLAFALYLQDKANNYWSDLFYMTIMDDYDLEQAKQDYELSYNFITKEYGIEMEYSPP